MNQGDNKKVDGQLKVLWQKVYPQLEKLLGKPGHGPEDKSGNTAAGSMMNKRSLNG